VKTEERAGRTRKSPGLLKLYDEIAQACINYGGGDSITVRIPQHLSKKTGLVVTVRERRPRRERVNEQR